jgi:light-regulated signal transduction histidine kinase (bacteriophytochrome)
MIFGDMLSKGNAAGDETRYIKKILDSSKRMQLFINDLLQFSRHHVSETDFAEMPLTNIINEVIGDFELNIKETNAQINIGELPVIYIIPGLVRQLFYNLIGNSLKFRRANLAPAINIYSEKTRLSPLVNNKPLNGDITYYKICIADNGIGFDEKYADEIFGVFKRLHAYHEFEGTGIGLSICKKIVEKHNGFITAIGKPGEGSLFTIGFPEKQPLGKIYQ